MANQQGKIKVLYIVEFFVLAVIITVVVYALQTRNKGNTQNDFEQNSNQDSSIVVNQNIPILPADDDGDGLSNDREIQLGTNSVKADSDDDGLTDWDEIEVYKSDPLNKDSDSDGNLDGDEVANGYSPTDETRLLDLEREKSKLNE